MKTKDKEKMIEALEGVKEFELVFTEEVTYSKTFKAKSKEELQQMWEENMLSFGDEDMIDSEYIMDSVEIYEE